MNTQFHDHSPDRRRFLAGAAGLAVLAAVPVTVLSASTGAGVNRPRAWLGRFDELLGLWLPAEHTMREAVPPKQPLTLIIRGPWTLSGPSTPALALGVVYHSLPARPFLLPDGRSGGIMLHAEASALAGLHVGRRGEPVASGTLCSLGCGTGPALLPGRYALLIDDTGALPAPDWSALADDGAGHLCYQRRPAPWAILSVHIAPA